MLLGRDRNDAAEGPLVRKVSICLPEPDPNSDTPCFAHDFPPLFPAWGPGWQINPAGTGRRHAGSGREQRGQLWFNQ